ncbi:MAG: hypothetical protein AB1651_06795 [Pseudomonadota bacterium]
MVTAATQDGRVSTLEAVLSYRNDNVLDSFCESFEVSREDAEDIFRETLRFLWLSTNYRAEFLQSIDRPILIIDEMWHTFILFTKEYHEFCSRMFGHYMHHTPTTVSEKKRLRSEMNDARLTALREEKKKRYSMIYDLLGRDVFIKWYYEFPERFSPRRIREMRRK